MQVHVAMLALHTGRPVKMVYSREESFFGHVHRHPARMEYEHGADARRAARLRARPGRARRRRLRLQQHRRGGQQRHLRVRPLRRAQRPHRRAGGLHQQPALRRHARLRGGAGGVRPRVPDGPARGRARDRSGGDPADQRHVHRHAPAHRPGGRRARPGARAAGGAARHAAAARRAQQPRGPARDARRRLQHHPRRGHPAGRGLRGRLQEHRLRRGLRRLLHRAGAPVARPPRARWRRSTARPPRWARAW